MAIVTLLAIETDMAIVTILALKSIFMAIITVLAIETDMAIATVLASKPIWLSWPSWPSKSWWLLWPYWPSKLTFMAIVTALAIETDIHGYCDRPGHWNRYGYRDHTSLKTDMAIVTVLAIETDIHGYRDCPGHRNQHSWLLWPSWPLKPIFIFPELNRVSNVKNSFKGSLWGTVHISLINADIAKTVTSLLRRCLFLPRDTLLHSDLSCYSWNKWYDSNLCKPCWQRWGHGHRRLGWSLSGLACDLSDATSFSPSESLFWRSRHSRTARNMDARRVGDRPEDAKQKM